MSGDIERALAEQGFFISTTVGVSMYPMLRNRRDTVVIRPCRGRLAKYDVPLYKRGDRYVLHRIIRVLPDSYIICGDNCVRKERGITDAQILGVLTECYRGERKMRLDGAGYRLYVRLWRVLYPVRCVWHWLKVPVRALRRTNTTNTNSA